MCLSRNIMCLCTHVCMIFLLVILACVWSLHCLRVSYVRYSTAVLAWGSFTFLASAEIIHLQHRGTQSLVAAHEKTLLERAAEVYIYMVFDFSKITSSYLLIFFFNVEWMFISFDLLLLLRIYSCHCFPSSSPPALHLPPCVH